MNYIAQENEHLNEQGLPVCNLCGGERYVVNPNNPQDVRRALCACQTKERNEKQKAFETQQERAKIDQARSISLLGKRYATATFQTYKLTDDNKTALKVATSYAEKHKEMLDKGYGIYVYGKNGTGKTHLLACICNYLLEHGERCIFTNFTDVVNDLHSAMTQNKDITLVIDKYTTIPFLFIDDFGKESYKKISGNQYGWLDEQLFLILNKRYNNMLPTLFSSNFTLEELADAVHYDGSLIDRVSSMATRKIRLDGKSQRESGNNV